VLERAVAPAGCRPDLDATSVTRRREQGLSGWNIVLRPKEAVPCLALFDAPWPWPASRRHLDQSIEVFAACLRVLDGPYGRPVGAPVLLERADPGAEPFTPVAAPNAR
jgi:hypothetical protein